MNLHAATHIGRVFSLALVFIVGSVCLSGLQAQTIYKCGNTYSQVACPDAQTVQVDDSRKPEQKQHADAATQRDAKLAKSLEMERLAQEKSTQRATKPKRKASSTAAPKKDATDDMPLTKITPKRPHSKAAKPDGFVAQVPASGPKSVVKK
jgi:hypothetical protein